MEEWRLPLAVVPLQTCFVSLPRALIQRLGPALSHVVLQLEWAQPNSAEAATAWVGWGGTASAREELEVPAALAEAIGLRPPQLIRVRVVELPVAVSLTMEPETNEDWELAQREAQQLEDQILTQVLVASRGQRLPLWVNGGQSIWLRVTGCSPDIPAVRLGSGTELHV